MLINRHRIIQLIWLVSASGFLAVALYVASHLDTVIEENDLEPPQQQVAQQYPEQTLLSIAPGGLRVWAVNILWVRLNKAKEAGRYYDAYQLAEIVCMLQPRSPGVWQFHAWNMAWNISAALHTEEERWIWITNAYHLLRDKGIPLNPQSLELYKELSWLFNNKIGDNMDDMHFSYKRRWAAEMHGVLGSPPAGSTADVIAAFKEIADAPVDKSPGLSRGTGNIQKDVLKRNILDVDNKASKFVSELRESGIELGKSITQAKKFLITYQKFSKDEVVLLSTDPVNRSVPVTNDEKKLASLMNDEEYDQARRKLLAFVRVQILWDEYRMDPDFMLKMMVDNNMPLDWRLPWPHGMYWAWQGFLNGKNLSLLEVDTLNTLRNILMPFKLLSSYGRMMYTENIKYPTKPRVYMLADTRYIEATHQKHIELIDEYVAERRKIKPDFKRIDCPLVSGHANYLRDSILTLFRAYMYDQATEYWQYVRDNYNEKGFDEGIDSPKEYVRWYYSQKDKSRPRPEIVQNQLTASLQAGWYLLANGNVDGFKRHVMNPNSHAKTIYQVFQSSAPKRNTLDRKELGPFLDYELRSLINMIMIPQACGYRLTLTQQALLWKHALGRRLSMPSGDSFSYAAYIYDYVTPSLLRQAQAQIEDMDPTLFKQLFPEPNAQEVRFCRELRKMQQEQSQ